MTKDQLKNFTRGQIEDRVTPYQLTDDDFIVYLRESEREAFERASLGRIDYSVSIVASQSTYELTDVIELTRVKISGESRPLTKTTKRELDFELGPWDQQDADTPKYYFLVGDTLTLYPTPSASGTLLLDGFRYPYYDMETPERLHESLAYWIMYRFYSVPDADTHDPARAQFFEDKFSQVFGKRRNERFVSAWREGQQASTMAAHPFN